MSESREKLDMTAIEEMIRRDMPMLDTPDSLSADAVTRHLEKNVRRQKTPVYIFVRTAVAAALVMAIGIGAVYAVRQINTKSAKEDIFIVDGEYSEEDYQYKSESEPSGTAQSSTDDLNINGRKEEEAPEDSAEGSSAYSDAEECVVLLLETGEETVVDTDVPYSDALKISPVPGSSGEGNETEICETQIRESSSGTVQLYFRALSEGVAILELKNGDERIISVDVTVEN